MKETDLNIYWIRYIQYQIAHATDFERRYASQWSWRSAKEILESHRNEEVERLVDKLMAEDPWSMMNIRFNFVTWLFSKLINHEGPHRKDVWLVHMKLKEGRGLNKNDFTTLLTFFE